MRWALKARVLGLAAVGAAAALLSSCGAHAARSGDDRGHAPARRPIHSVDELSAGAPSSVARHALAPVGTTQHVDARGASLAVTLRRVIDPLGGSGAELPARTRAVGVVVQIRSTGPRLYDSSATGDITLVASNGAVTPVDATRGPCRTPRDDFDRYITAGEDRIGCVVFAVADGATLDAVRFSPHAQRHGGLSWAP